VEINAGSFDRGMIFLTRQGERVCWRFGGGSKVSIFYDDLMIRKPL
jgi:hypothetical protein